MSRSMHDVIRMRWRGLNALPVLLPVLLAPCARAAQPGYFMPPVLAHKSLGSAPSAVHPLIAQGRGFDLSLKAEAPPKVFAPDTLQSVLRHLGPVSVEQKTTSPIAMEHGVTTVFALPVQAIPGLDLTASFFGGHRDTRLGAPPGSAAVTGGLRFRW
ncbi:hypothetical protein ACFFGF_07465 [Asaia lannensis]|uniref:Autotransporter domain-containing protein n=1 Tax=Asaia lannensis NBRC 102526 TaxID=1307926 RepID=A0ABT1CJ29_9PROT|nr:hypothetical protein [Asaia lannensis]MCO6160857.1 hypothetical protein [Asaia lannensis NBRC 102526]GBR01432.1 hypothetical protein AA102526_2506 [Asaia lannensis NBRC 102526]